MPSRPSSRTLSARVAPRSEIAPSRSPSSQKQLTLAFWAAMDDQTTWKKTADAFRAFADQIEESHLLGPDIKSTIHTSVAPPDAKVAYQMPPTMANYKPAFLHPDVQAAKDRIRAVEAQPQWWTESALSAKATEEVHALIATVRDVRDAIIADEALLWTLPAVVKAGNKAFHGTCCERPAPLLAPHPATQRHQPPAQRPPSTPASRSPAPRRSPRPSRSSRRTSRRTARRARRSRRTKRTTWWRYSRSPRRRGRSSSRT